LRPEPPMSMQRVTADFLAGGVFWAENAGFAALTVISNELYLVSAVMQRGSVFTAIAKRECTVASAVERVALESVSMNRVGSGTPKDGERSLHHQARSKRQKKTAERAQQEIVGDDSFFKLFGAN